MGVVYAGEDLELKRKVALKFLPPHLSADAEAIQRFVQEAQSASALQHANVCTIFEIGRADDGRQFIAMAYYDGATLKQKLEGGPLPVDDACSIARQIADGLAAAHANGIVHRDIKPANIMITQDNRAIILDFGLAKLAGTGHLTKTGSTLGTVAYMSPEQIRGEPVDERTDLWSLGVVLYEMLAGQRPFVGDYEPAVTYAILNEPLRGVAEARPEINERLDRVVRHLLTKEPGERCESAVQLIEELTVGPSPKNERTARVSGRRLPFRAAAWTILGTVAVALAILLWRFLESPDKRVEIVRTFQFTHEPGLEVDPALSPDGKMVAFAATHEDRRLILVRQVSGGRTIALTEDVPGEHRWPRWSPDGTRVLFISDEGVFVIPALGGHARRVIERESAEPIFGAAWSPEADRIVYAHGNAIKVRSLESRESIVMAEVFEPHSASWSPDGKWIAFASGNPHFVFGTVILGNLAPSAVSVVSVDGGEPTLLTESEVLSISPIWTADSRHLLYVSNRGGGRDLYRVGIGKAGTVHGRTERLTTGLDAHSVSMSRDGELIAYSQFVSSANVWSVPISEDGPASVTDAQPVTTGNQRIESINVSNDGRWLAFDSDRAGNQDIYKIPVEGGAAIQLTRDPADDFAPSWSPDGRWVAFHSFRDGNRELYVVSANGEVVERVTNHPSQDRAPDWAPDGKRLVFFSDRSGRQELYLIARNSGGWGEPKQLTFEGGLHAEWSPVGEDIAYISGSSTHTMSSEVHELRVISADGTGRRTLVQKKQGRPVPEAPEWSPDGRWVYYKAFDDSGSASISRVSPMGGTIEAAVRFDDPRRQTLYRHELALSATRAYFTLGEYESDVWLMEVDSRD